MSSSSSNSFSSPRDGPNPLRPYYVPPSIGVPHDPGIPVASNITSHGRSRGTGTGLSSSSQSFSSAREILADLDYSEYTDASLSAADMVKQLLDQALWKYTSVLLAQPFEVAKTVLECQVIPLTDR